MLESYATYKLTHPTQKKYKRMLLINQYWWQTATCLKYVYKLSLPVFLSSVNNAYGVTIGKWFSSFVLNSLPHYFCNYTSNKPVLVHIRWCVLVNILVQIWIYWRSRESTICILLNKKKGKNRPLCIKHMHIWILFYLSVYLLLSIRN